MNRDSQNIVAVWKSIESKNFNQYVRINYDAITKTAKDQARNSFKLPAWRETVYARREWAFAAQQIFVNCFNAHFNVIGKPDMKYTVANPYDSARFSTGAFALQSTIYGYLGETIPHSSDFEKHVKSPRLMAEFFGGIVKMPSPELKQECGKDFIENLEDKYQGNPLNLLEDAMTGEDRERKALRAFNNGKGLVEILTVHFGKAYSDTQKLEIGGSVDILNFNKRAQLVVAMLHDRAIYSNGILPLVEDIDEVGPICDYELPKALRSMDILKYSESLAEAVDNWFEIRKDGQMEIELRMATAVACCKLLEEINRYKLIAKLERGAAEIPLACLRPINICHLDYWLWMMGRKAKHLRPHITRTSAY